MRANVNNRYGKLRITDFHISDNGVAHSYFNDGCEVISFCDKRGRERLTFKDGVNKAENFYVDENGIICML